MRPAFSLLELLIVIGIMGILAAIVITALNPTKQLNDARNASRTNGVLQTENAVNQYIVDGGSFAGVPEGIASAMDICRDGVVDPSCYSLDVLVPDYIVNIPLDPSEESTTVTGYRIYLHSSLKTPKVCSVRKDVGCGG